MPCHDAYFLCLMPSRVCVFVSVFYISCRETPTGVFIRSRSERSEGMARGATSTNTLRYLPIFVFSIRDFFFFFCSLAKVCHEILSDVARHQRQPATVAAIYPLVLSFRCWRRLLGRKNREQRDSTTQQQEPFRHSVFMIRWNCTLPANYCLHLS